MPFRRPSLVLCLSSLSWFVLVLSLAGPAKAEVPRFAGVAGHEFGERITQHHEMARYLEALAASSPRVTVIDQGATWEGRHLLLAVVTAPENHARLKEIQSAARSLADPRGLSPRQAEELIETQPAIVWLGGSIHGFELSGSEGLLKLLEHLATRDDEATLEALRDTVVLIDAMINPDGRDAFAQYNHQHIGRGPNPSRADWNNDFTSWQALQFRTGHYFFDTNRDWFAHTQRETVLRIPTLLAWRPQVMVDAHEMGPDVEFYFDPPAEPTAPYFPEHSVRWLKVFGEAYSDTFDGEGFEYTSKDIFNFFYPGYTSSYGNYLGAVSMLFEQGSSRGLALERSDESVRTLADALEQQYRAAWTTVRTAGERRQELLRDYAESFRAAVADGSQGARRYLLESSRDPGLLAEAVALLRRNGVEVGRLTEEVELASVRDRAGEPLGERLGKRRFPVGTWVVEAAQPHNRLVRTLLEPQIPVPEEFLTEARARLDRGENPRFYDMTAWSLPLLFDLRAFSSEDGRDLPVHGLDGAAKAPEAAAEEGFQGIQGFLGDSKRPYAYLLDGRRAASLAALTELRRQGLRAVVTVMPTRVDGADVPSGTVVVRRQGDPDALSRAVETVAERWDLPVRAVSTGRGDGDSPALGDDDFLRVREPKIAILAGEPVSGYSFGWAWYTLDRQYEIPTTVLQASSIASTPLDRFNVLVVPDLFGSLGNVLGDGGKDRLKRWVQEGGTLVVLGEAVELARRELELIQLRNGYPDPPEEGAEPSEELQRIAVPGAFFRAELDPESWLTAGYDQEPTTPDLPALSFPALVFTSDFYLAPEGPPNAGRRVVARYAKDEPVKLSGHAWKESLERLPDSVLVYEERVGGGRVVAFVEDPNFRGYWRGADRLFLNAVVLGPSAP